ncbi:MAG: FecR family protein [Phenylobacterium sp.]
MTMTWTRDDEARVASAADWLARLSAPDLADAELAEFDAWLAAPANASAYDAALAVSLELQAAASAILADLARPRRHPSGRPIVGRRGWLVAGGLAAAATIALAILPFTAIAPTTQSLATGKGEHRSIKLADGSTIDLNAGSTLTVALGAHERRVVMGDGEAVFDVAHDPARPFLIAAGDRTVRVVGTRFDVRRRGGRLSVAVERGLVEVDPTLGAPGRGFRLHPGQRLDHLEGAPDVALTLVDPAQIGGWKTGRLIFRDQPLAEVVADLNQQFATPIVIDDPTLAQTRVSGVLVLDDQAAVIRRLALLAPIKALPSPQGVTLRRDQATKP